MASADQIAYDEATGPRDPHARGSWRLTGEGPEDTAHLAVLVRYDALYGKDLGS